MKITKKRLWRIYEKCMSSTEKITSKGVLESQLKAIELTA